MKLNEAVDFLRPAIASLETPQRWADLGCGSGLFTQALASLLPSGSSVYAVDKQDAFSVKGNGDVRIAFHQADFVNDQLPCENLDGLLMANALHYVADKRRFVEKGERFLKEEGIWVVIEYDTGQSNRWVPYPIPFKNLENLFLNAGYKQIEKMAERPSVYRSGNMYCAVAKR